MMCDLIYGEGLVGGRVVRETATQEITDPTLEITYHEVRGSAAEMKKKEIYLVKMLGERHVAWGLLKIGRWEKEESGEVLETLAREYAV